VWNRSQKQTPAFIAKSTDKVKSAVVKTAGTFVPVDASPDESMRALFDAVQEGRVFPDGKTFPDMIPKVRAKLLAKEYETKRIDPSFRMQDFVHSHFTEPYNWKNDYLPDDKTTARQHVRSLWQVLRRRNRRNRGSLIALPHDYIVPGGRFSEQFYWDTYFVMLGLAADEEWSLIDGMVRNCAYMLRRFGSIPTANRTYFLSRSQPPFFAQMVRLLAQHNGRIRTFAEFLPAMLSEYRFWMKGRKVVIDNHEVRAYARVVSMPDGSVLNRYYDNKMTPRPESLREDNETAHQLEGRDREKLFLNLRAGAESGWDFSTRWLREGHGIQTIDTTNIVAVDLNCLLYQLEQTLAETYTLLKQPLLARRFVIAAERRATAIRRYCWDASKGFFVDYDMHSGASAGKLTLAGVFPLYARIATTEQAAKVAVQLEKHFLKKGGLLTTLEQSGQQWDAPNGWAHLQWIAIKGLREYGYFELADKIRDRWVNTCEKTFATSRKMLEKYDVVTGGAGAGGEYPLQDGFGWTNGVYAVLKDEQEKQHAN